MRTRLAVVLCALFILMPVTCYGQLESDQRPRVPAKEQTNGTAERQSPADYQPDAPHKSGVVNAPPSDELKKKAYSDGTKGANEASEFWVIANHRLKITDTLLAAFTFILCLIGAWQGYQLQRTVTATKELGRAAVDLELPKLRILDVHLGEGTRRPENERHRLKAPVITVRVANFGKTPAFIKNWLIGIHVSPYGLPVPPRFQGMVRVERDLAMPVIMSNAEAPLIEREFGDDNRPTDDQIDDILSRDTDDFLLIYGLIEFEDYEGRKYERTFAVRWMPSINVHPEGCATWEQEGYNYQGPQTPEYWPLRYRLKWRARRLLRKIPFLRRYGWSVHEPPDWS